MADGILALGIYQAAGIPGDVEANLAEMISAMDRAAAEGVELLVCPEGFLTGYYLPGIDVASLPATRHAVAQICGHAKTAGIALVFGLAERSPDGIYNTAIAVSAEGEILARYRKRALFGDWEKGFFAVGSGPVLFPLHGYTVGILICYDLEFPELARETATAGANLIVVPTSLMVPNDAVADHLVPTRALENQVFVAYANRTGAESGLAYVGKSSICDPHGRALAKAGGAEPELIKATIEKAAIDESRTRFSYRDDLLLLGAKP